VHARLWFSLDFLKQIVYKALLRPLKSLSKKIHETPDVFMKSLNFMKRYRYSWIQRLYSWIPIIMSASDQIRDSMCVAVSPVGPRNTVLRRGTVCKGTTVRIGTVVSMGTVHRRTFVLLTICLVTIANFVYYTQPSFLTKTPLQPIVHKVTAFTERDNLGS
jgi:hypothetical protein